MNRHLMDSRLERRKRVFVPSLIREIMVVFCLSKPWWHKQMRCCRTHWHFSLLFRSFPSLEKLGKTVLKFVRGWQLTWSFGSCRAPNLLFLLLNSSLACLFTIISSKVHPFSCKTHLLTYFLCAKAIGEGHTRRFPARFSGTFQVLANGF